MMSAQYHCYQGAIDCHSSRQCSAPVSSAGKGFGCGSSFRGCSRPLSPSRCRLQSTKTVLPHGGHPHRFARIGESVYYGPLIPQFEDAECDLPWSQGIPVITLLPLAVVALAISRATSIMVSLSKNVEIFRDAVTKNSRDASIVEEFTQAAKGIAPWRPGLEKALLQQGGISLALLSATAIAHDHLNPVISTLRANPTFMSGLIAWAIAQVTKVFTYYMVVRKLDFRMVMGSGGMPSSHSALCFALTTSVAFVHGVSDALFPVCLGFTLIVMYDAAGVRRHAGKQAEVLNMIVADLFQGHPISERKLKELLGHTPLQVFAGAALGVIVGYFCSRTRVA